MGVAGESSGSARCGVPVTLRSSIRPMLRRPSSGGTPSRRSAVAAEATTPARRADVGRAPPSVWVRVTPWPAGSRPVSSVARLGEHMHVLTKAWVKVRPVRRSSASAGASSRTKLLARPVLRIALLVGDQQDDVGAAGAQWISTGVPMGTRG